MDLTKGDMIIFSGEGDSGTWERYFGARTKKAIRSKLSRERCGGDCWASVWIEIEGIEDKGHPGEKVYGELGPGLDEVPKQRAVPAAIIRESPAAKLAASKRGRSSASAENGKAGGRPRYEVRHFFSNPRNNKSLRCATLNDAKEKIRKYESDESGDCSHLYKNEELIAWRDHDKKTIRWM